MMKNGWTKESLEAFLSKEMGEPVICDEPDPVMYKTISLAHFGVLGMAQVYKGKDGVMKAALVPFGTFLLAQEMANG
jgi:hypothetical protein